MSISLFWRANACAIAARPLGLALSSPISSSEARGFFLRGIIRKDDDFHAALMQAVQMSEQFFVAKETHPFQRFFLHPKLNQRPDAPGRGFIFRRRELILLGGK